MKKIKILFFLSLSVFLLFSCNYNKKANNTINDTESTESAIEYNNYDLNDYIDNLILNTPSYIPYWNKESYKGRWNYIDGVFLNSILEYSKVKNDNKYIDFVKNYVNYYIKETGEFLYISSQEEYNPTINGAFRANELDSYCESRILFDLYQYTKDERYNNAINRSYDYLLNMPMCVNNINYCHKAIYNNQIYLDGFYMYVPFLVKYANFKKDYTIYDNIIKQYKYVYEHQRNTENGLYYHCLDTAKSIFWANKETGVSESVWSRGLGWYIMSLVDSIEYFPKDKQTYLINILNEAINSIYKYKDNDTNMYYQLIDKGNTSYEVSYDKYLKYLNNQKYTSDATISNYLESSGSSMIAYTMMKGARLNYLDNKYLNIGKKSFEGIYNHSFNKTNNTLNDICLSAGLGPENKPYRDGTPYYYLAEKVVSNDAKGVGPFIMAYIEYIR